jgi:hypothetical protein
MRRSVQPGWSIGPEGHDTGAFVAPEMGRLAPERLLGIHLNALIAFPSQDPADLAALTEREQARLAYHKAFRETGMGYAQIQGTRPQTLAYGLTDSPVGQLAWIFEKFKEWTDPAADLPEDAVDRDRLPTRAKSRDAFPTPPTPRSAGETVSRVIARDAQETPWVGEVTAARPVVLPDPTPTRLHTYYTGSAGW